MAEILSWLLRFAGIGLITLAILHIPIGRHLKWREEAMRLSLANASIFRSHTFFICLVLVMMGLPCLIDPQIFLIPSRAGGWLVGSLSVFWLIRLYFQWFVYQGELWRGKRMETQIHWLFTLIWSGLSALFALCACVQAGWW